MPIGLDVQMHTSSPDVVRLPETAQFVRLSYTSMEDPSIRCRCHRDPEWLRHRIVASPPCTCHRHHYHSSMTSSSCRSSPSSCSSLWRTGCSHSTSLPRRNRDGKMPCDSSTAGVLGRILNSTCKGMDRHRRRCCMVLRSRESPILPLLPIYRDPPRFRVERCSSTCLFPGEGAGWWIHKRSCELRGSDDCTPSQRQASCYRCRPDRTNWRSSCCSGASSDCSTSCRCHHRHCLFANSFPLSKCIILGGGGSRGKFTPK
jgi:hypothetical protein